MTMDTSDIFGDEGSAVPVEMDHRQVLHVGSGPVRAEKLHPVFRTTGWSEVRIDVDPNVKPDMIVDIADMAEFETGSFDAVWCSHCLEHLDEHEAIKALREFCRVLKPTGFALITSPDIYQIAQLVVAGREDEVAYVSPAGEVRAIDMLFGFQPAVASGNHFMRHNTGFTRSRLGRMMQEAGFAETRILPGQSYDLWAAGFCSRTDVGRILDDLAEAGLDFSN